MGAPRSRRWPVHLLAMTAGCCGEGAGPGQGSPRPHVGARGAALAATNPSTIPAGTWPCFLMLTPL